ncbi:hypothetical protein HDV57DRAFT_517869 [Trichoderma longibrachiatum]|uniref:Uncharacterized protein n=1 Tax=Trichoderma longibrachiatum ATCC 18648 TaxID=983965 RepID=A0A2T4BT26_TRILO|nr:hypothetical protein M440DRAFT_1425601 [Trichoderma longibrachiatum ATCC 18648]
MTTPVESASHKGQRRPEVPKCRRPQLEALPAGEVARALALGVVAVAASHVQRKPDGTDQPRCGASEQALRLVCVCVRVDVRVARRGSVKWHRVGHAHAQRRSEGDAVGRPGATSVSVASAALEPRFLGWRSSMSRPTPRPDDRKGRLSALTDLATHVAKRLRDPSYAA